MCDPAIQGSKELGAIIQFTAYVCDLCFLCKTILSALELISS